MKDREILNIKDITDSSEVLLEKPKRIILLLAYILVVLIVVALIFMGVGHIDEYVKASGVMRPGEKTSSIDAIISGKVIEFNLSEGKQVKAGDILFKMDSEIYKVKIDEIERLQTLYNGEKENLEKLEQSIIDGINLFDNENPKESEYYYRYQQYVLNSEKSEEQYKNTNLDYENIKVETNINESNSKKQLSKLQDEYNQLLLFKTSIEEQNNCLDNTISNFDFYDLQLKNYNIDVERYVFSINELEMSIEKYEKLYNVGGVSKSEVDNLKSRIDENKLELEKYKTEFLLNTQKTIDEISKSIDEYKNSIENSYKLSELYSQRGYDKELSLNLMQVNEILSVREQINQYESMIETNENDLNELKLNMENTVVSSPIDGTVVLYNEINIGDYVQGGTNIANIIPYIESDFKIQIYVQGKDINDVFIGQDVKLRFSALPYKDYGEFNAKIINVSTDARTDTNSNINYYLAEAVINDEVLQKDDDLSNLLKSGMECEARIITKQRRIIEWVLHKINILD